MDRIEREEGMKRYGTLETLEREEKVSTRTHSQKHGRRCLFE